MYKRQPVYEQWKSVGTKNWNDQKPIVTGYTSNSDRYWASLHVQNAPDVPAKNWNDQKAVVTGYTQPGDKYFATRQRLAYHPRDKTFQPEIAASVSGSASTQTAPPPPKPAPKPAEKAPPAPPVYEQWKSVGTKNWNDQKPIVTGYTANSDRYWASLHVQNAPDVPAKNWNDQKAVVTGYTQPGDKYFATRQRLAYHPRDKTFHCLLYTSPSPRD